MYKVIRPGTIPVYENKMVSVYCKIEYTDKKLSVSGVIGPTRDGNAMGGCGQIDMEFKHKNPDHDDKRYNDHLIKPSDFNFADGWNTNKWYQFLEYWKLYHLNDMKTGCKHQRAENWGEKTITIYTYTTKTEVWQKQNKIKESNMELPKKGEKVKLSKEEILLLNLPSEITGPENVISEKGITKYYKLKGKEDKTTGWVYQKEHPEGVMCKPCPICGYKYGSSWLHEDVPENVIKWLFDLPETDQEPAWV